jgi:hypothetical protein
MEVIGIALNVPGDRMFVIRLGRFSQFRADLDGKDERNLLSSQETLPAPVHSC